MSRWMPCSLIAVAPWARAARAAAGALLLASTALVALAWAAPRVIVISLDGATPRLVDEQMAAGVLGPTRGLGLLQEKGIRADRNLPESFGALSSLGGLHVWLGLKNSDDQGTSADLMAEVYKNGDKIGEGLLRCIRGLTRDPGRATEVVVVPALGAAQTFDGSTDTLMVKLLARIGTNPDGTKCAGGHVSAAGLRAYFDAAVRPSRLSVGLEER